MRQAAAHSLRRLVSRFFIRCYPEIQRMGPRVRATTSECIMFTIMARERAFCKSADAAHPNQTFEEGHVCILRAVTRATLIFYYTYWSYSDLSPSDTDSHWDWVTVALWHWVWLSETVTVVRLAQSLSSSTSGRDSCDYVFHSSASIGKHPLTFSLNLSVRK